MVDNSTSYLARADQSARDATEAALPNVRERCLRAEKAWRKMAAQALKLELSRERQLAEKARVQDDEAGA